VHLPANARNDSERKKVAAFERERCHLLSVAFRILGKQCDAEDAVQDAWIKFDRSDTNGVRNLPAWLTAVVTRLCLDSLRRQREVPQEAADLLECDDYQPEEIALLADELTDVFAVVLDALTPPQRVPVKATPGADP
jgi:RNA polymerase sigma-70 factor (ECF subfamily)